MSEGGPRYPIIFKINEERNGARIGVTYADDVQYLGRYRDIAMEIFNGVDYSKCPEIKGGRVAP